MAKEICGTCGDIKDSEACQCEPLENSGDEFGEIFEESKPPDLFVVDERYGLMPPMEGDEATKEAYLKELQKQVTGSDEPIDDSKVGFYVSDKVIDNQKGFDDLVEYSKDLANRSMLAELQQQPGFVSPASQWLEYQRLRRRFLKVLYMDVVSMVAPTMNVASYLHFVNQTLKAFDDAHDAENLSHD